MEELRSFALGTTNPVATITGASGGTFSATGGLTIDANTGEIDLSTATAGNYQVTYTPASNWQQIGQSVVGKYVSINYSGDIIAVKTKSGLAKVFTKISNNWVQLGNDITGFQGSNYYDEIALDSAGKRVIICSSVNSLVKIFEWDNTSWTQIGQNINQFSSCVDISSDGNTIIMRWRKSLNRSGGVALVYQYDGTIWTLKGLPIYGLNDEWLGYKASINSSEILFQFQRVIFGVTGQII